MPANPTAEEIRELRERHYNAEVVGVRRVHEELAVIRVRPDDGVPSFEPGQYTTLGLGRWEPRDDGIESEFPAEGNGLIRRAYSIGCPLLDETGELLPCSRCDFFEFYVTLVRRASDDPPQLTPRLFALREGDRLYVTAHPHGNYTLEHVDRGDDVVFAATGTGEAPHNAMLAELLARGHQGRIASLTCVRYLRDLAYREAHAHLQRRFPNYRYVPLTTREPYNVDPDHPGYIGQQYLQEYFSSGRFSDDLDWPLAPERTHVYLCGNPQMIGVPRRDDEGRMTFPEPRGMVEVLVERGFKPDEPRQPGNIHFEKYW